MSKQPKKRTTTLTVTKEDKQIFESLRQSVNGFMSKRTRLTTAYNNTDFFSLLIGFLNGSSEEIERHLLLTLQGES